MTINPLANYTDRTSAVVNILMLTFTDREICVVSLTYS
jgi:hypothetical protein